MGVKHANNALDKDSSGFCAQNAEATQLLLRCRHLHATSHVVMAALCLSARTAKLVSKRTTVQLKRTPRLESMPFNTKSAPGASVA